MTHFFENITFFQRAFSHPFWQKEILGNTLEGYVMALLAFLVLVLILKIIELWILRYFQKAADRTETDIDNTFLQVIGSVKPPFYFFLALYLAVELFLRLGTTAEHVFKGILIIWVVYQVIYACEILVNYVVRRFLAGKNGSGADSMAQILGTVVKIVLWTFGIILILGNLGFNVTSLIAGLGVAGIAVGLALQPVLTDLFSAFAIYFDKPFQVGDFIIIDDKMGTVQRVGIKTTRIQALNGEEIIMTNSKLLASSIHNYQKMKRRRVLFGFGVTRDTGIPKLREISGMVKTIIDKIDNVDFDRGHFKSFDDSSLAYEVVYYVNSSSYNDYMDIQQEINLALCEYFAEENIKMAYPTQTVLHYNMDEYQDVPVQG
ncbi:MAG TPA: mechanosensitive ion channel family protein [Candidatus Paceibacterota bacterium]|nr:mechanosensitive ion channel family protein [Candidatus Paceibacterota bacterium]